MTTFQRPSDSARLSVCLLAGEASGDAQGALLAQALVSEFSKAGLQVSLWGSAGRQMKKAGVEAVVDIDELSAMGFAEVVSAYPRLSAAAHRLQGELRNRLPDLTILIDYPGLNMRLMEDAFHLGSCVVYHIPPKVWAHGLKRVVKLRDCTYLVTCILPFEEKLLQRAGIQAKFIGNPLNDEVQDFLGKHRSDLPLRSDQSPCVGIVPGSRSGEIERVFPEMVKAFVRTRSALQGRLRAVVPVAQTVSRSRLEFLLNESLAAEGAQQVRADVELISEKPLIEVLYGCRYAWVCSGTAALETALMGIPHSMVYKMHWLTHAIARRIVRLPYFSLENLCAERELVPEFIQDAASPQALSEHALQVLQSPALENKMHEELVGLRGRFPAKSARNAAHEIVNCFLDLPRESGRRFHFKAARDLCLEEKEWGLNN